MAVPRRLVAGAVAGELGGGKDGAVMGENSKIEWTDHTFNPWLASLVMCALLAFAAWVVEWLAGGE